MKRSRSHAIVRNYWIPIVCVCLAVTLVVALLYVENNYKGADDFPAGNGISAEKIVFPAIENEVLLCSGVAKKLYDNQMDIKAVIQTDNPYRPIVLEYNAGTYGGTLFLSEYANFSKVMEYELQPFHTVFRLDNLKTGTEYYYKIVINGEEQGGSFRTQESTRFVYIPGIEDTRDIGGCRTLDGKIVRQGMIIRGTEIDGLKCSAYTIADFAVESTQKMFGFVYDFDLRSRAVFSGDYQSPLGDDVGHAFYAAPQYEQIFERDWQVSLRRIFADLAKPANYPMYMHCTWGKDQTGIVVFLLQGVLNVSQEDMMQEYLLSAFVHPEIADDNPMEAVVEKLNGYEGDTLQEKIVCFLTEEVGVSMKEIISIRNILLSDVP